MRNRKMGMGLMMAVAALLPLVAGCALFGSDPASPTELETRFFDIETNLVPRITTRTNLVQVTNTVVDHVTVTNTDHQVVTHEVTNFVAQVVPVAVEFTNWHEAYVYKPNTNAADLKRTVGEVAGLSGIPGARMAGEILGGGLIGLWGWFRSSKKEKTAGALAQVIEVGRELFAQTPQGAAAGEAWKNWMISHQLEQGVIEHVVQLLPKAVDRAGAQDVATELLGLMGQVRGPAAVPVATTTVTG